MKVLLGATTDSGRRPNNEDSYAAVSGEELGIAVDAVLIVADGMGGRNFGEHASETAVDVVKNSLINRLSGGVPGHAEIKSTIEVALQQANDSVYELSQRDAESEGMGTTCVLAVVAQGRLHLGHAGDSRAYVIHHDRIEQLTDDHSFVAEQVRAGIITEETARKSKFRNVITRAVGIEPTIVPDVAEYPAEEVDAVLLCSDGLTNMVADRDIERVLLTAQSPQAATDKLVRMAKNAGGSDNITAVVARFGTGPIVDLTVADEQSPSAEVEVTREDEDTYRPPSGSRGPMTVVSLLLILFIAATIYLGAQLSQAGYRFQASPPFVVKPAPPAPPAPPNLMKMTYGQPQKFYPYPVRPEPLVFSQESKSLAVVSVPDDNVVRLSTDGTTLFKRPLPGASARGSATAASNVATSSAPRHFSIDPQGNIYLSDAAAHTIYKLRGSGEMIGKITAGLQKPEAIAVDDAGNIYVVDASTLKFIPATPAR